MKPLLPTYYRGLNNYQCYCEGSNRPVVREHRSPSARMRWPKWEMRARHFDKKFRQSDEFSQNLPAKNVQSFAKILKKFFENKKDDCKKNTDQRTPDCDMLKNNSMVSYDYSLQRCVLQDRDADGSWTMQWGIEDATASHSQAETTRLGAPEDRGHQVLRRGP